MDPQRPTERGRSVTQHQPAVKVVGFHVEGVPPSPSPHTSVLNDPALATHVGSPSPVIIPPSFQTESPIRRADHEDELRARLRQSSTVTGLTAPQVSSPSGLARQLSGIREADPRPTTPFLENSLSSTAPTATGLLRHETASALDAGPTRSVSDPTTFGIEKEVPPATVPRQDGEMGGPGGTQQLVGTPGSAASSNLTTESGHAAPLQGQASTAQQSGAGQDKGAPPAGDKPKLTRAQRREQQEKQREAKKLAMLSKAESTGGAPPATNKSGPVSRQTSAVPPSRGGSTIVASSTLTGKTGKSVPPSAKEYATSHMSTQSLELFSHLPPYRQVTVRELLFKAEAAAVHASIFRLAVQLAEGKIRGSNARCIAMLEAFVDVIQDYVTPEGKTLQRDLLAQLNNAIHFMVYCRPLSVSMGNAIKYVKLCISRQQENLPPSDADAKEDLVDAIQRYVENKILGCCKLLVDKAVDKIDGSGDTVLTYGMSSVVFKILCAAKQAGKEFGVIVVDSRPLQAGQEMTRRLLGSGVSVMYADISGLSFCMKEATKVFLGASAVLSNGTVISSVGATMVALSAQAAHVPVMICSETHKFHERVQLDSITSNELGNPNALVKVPGRPELTGLQGWEQVEKLGVLNLMYDAMPAEYIDVICTEFGSLPPSSVPVIIRECREDPYAFA